MMIPILTFLSLQLLIILSCKNNAYIWHILEGELRIILPSDFFNLESGYDWHTNRLGCTFFLFSHIHIISLLIFYVWRLSYIFSYFFNFYIKTEIHIFIFMVQLVQMREFSVWPLPEVEKWFQKPIWNEKFIIFK